MVFLLAKKRFCQQEQQFMAAKLPSPIAENLLQLF